jgi:FkbM family methyltransferase
VLNYRGLSIPKVSFGNLDSDCLFGDREQELFDLYESRRDRYKRALDIGANIGVHSILMARRGWEVMAFEPDPIHFREMLLNVLAEQYTPRRNIAVNMSKGAVSNRSGVDTFVRVKGNTTGSHISGYKQPYGDLDKYDVELVDARKLWPHADFAKIDAEGAEADILLTTTKEDMAHLDILVEVGNTPNAFLIFNHFRNMGIKMYSQNTGWKEVKELEDMPTHHSHGALFIGKF